jgi:hypothetical protein
VLTSLVDMHHVTKYDLHIIYGPIVGVLKLYDKQSKNQINLFRFENKNSPFLFTNMACSKIFSGNIPELTDEIIQHFRYDFSTLYSCILVNKLWCHLAIPLLWEDPFSIPTKNYHCIKIYLYYLNEDNKAKFNEYGIDDKLLTSNNTLFNYPSFIKYLNIHNICYSVGKWVEISVNNYDNYNNYKKLKELVYRSLFKVFIENEGNLHSFEIIMSSNNDCTSFNNNIELTLQNPNFIYNIKNLVFNIHYSYPDITNIIPFLKFLSFNCNSITSIIFNFPIFNINNDPSIIDEYLSQIIISQHNLEIISFEHNTPLYNPFLSLKNFNCSNTLNTIIFYLIDFKNIIHILYEVFDQLNVLKSIHIIYCYSLNSDFVHQIIKVIKPFKLISLFMEQILHVESLQLLLQKFGDYLENFGFGFMSEEYNNEPKRQLQKLIEKYCTKIKYFDSGVPDDINIYPLIKKHEQNINYLTIEVDAYSNITNNDEISLTVLRNLGQVLPSKLEYLCLTLIFSSNDLELFLKNSQNTFIKKLLISNITPDEFDNILFYIKKNIMKKERVKYLAILETCDECDKELFSLKDEVNEFKLHNIIIQKYNDLYITAGNFVKNYINNLHDI